MEININQKQISIGDKYKIFVDGNEQYRAARVLFRLMPAVRLFRLDDDIPMLTVRKKLRLFKATYGIELRNGEQLLFRTISFWKRQYTCEQGNNTYMIYGHRGRKFSIFLNDVQIAWWSKAAVSWFAGDNYQIIANHKADKEMLIAFCLIIDNFRHDQHDGNAVTVDIGNIGPQAKKFDESWKPS